MKLHLNLFLLNSICGFCTAVITCIFGATERVFGDFLNLYKYLCILCGIIGFFEILPRYQLFCLNATF